MTYTEMKNNTFCVLDSLINTSRQYVRDNIKYIIILASKANITF